MRTPRILPTLGLTLLAGVFSVPGYSHDDDHHGCDRSDLKGAYGFTASGKVLGASYAELGREVADGKGKLSGSATQSFDGVILTVEFKGTYTVNPDCTGTATLTATSAGIPMFMGRSAATGTRSFVIVEDGEEVNYIFTDDGTVVTGTGTRMASGKDGDDDDDDDDGHDGHDRGDHARAEHARARARDRRLDAQPRR